MSTMYSNKRIVTILLMMSEICSIDERNTLVVPVISFEVANQAAHLQAKLMRNQKLRGFMWLSHYQD
ncbi:hypothetical protein KY289_000538 [Solanum tuberosum]|nr:hypothetical protein KY284_000553 [Solanum tuberosum]KAH0729350.1 hypothetical protein KY289_000538 [Solanum tuberosum]